MSESPLLTNLPGYPPGTVCPGDLFIETDKYYPSIIIAVREVNGKAYDVLELICHGIKESGMHFTIDESFNPIDAILESERKDKAGNPVKIINVLTDDIPLSLYVEYSVLIDEFKERLKNGSFSPFLA